MDFIKIKQKYIKSGGLAVTYAYPTFIVDGDDLMIKGHSFYALWDDQNRTWVTDERKALQVIDDYVRDKSKDMPIDGILEIRDYSSKLLNEWTQFCKLCPDKYKDLDTKLRFMNSEARKKDYSTKCLEYSLEAGDISAYDRLMSVLYSEEEREKIEWAIGSIISGDSVKLQKFIVMYGPPGSGKSTVLKIIEMIFKGYYCYFDSKALGSNSDAFALDYFKDNPLVAIEHDGDLSRLEDNTKLNSIISHESMVVNEKYKSKYTLKFRSFLFMGTNKPVKITDLKSGLLRRLIDVQPSGNTVAHNEYDQLMSQITFELGAIAYHCLQVYKELGSKYYDKYRPMLMMSSTNDFYDFIENNIELFTSNDPISLATIWSRYQQYCIESNEKYPMKMRVFKNELKNYYEEFHTRYGSSQFSVYKGFKREMFDYEFGKVKKGLEESSSWLSFDKVTSLFDESMKDCLAQYASDYETPKKSWDKCRTRLSSVDTSKLHYVKVPENLIVIDFDLKGADGEKSYELNLKEASKWPKTYAEISKSGQGIHLHYYYEGDVTKLSRIYDTDIEIKVFTGGSSLRRLVSKCNDIEISVLKGGLPLKEDKGVLKDDVIKSERGLRSLIVRNLRKEIHPATKPSMDFIYQILEDAYNSGMPYDVTDMRADIQVFACGSTHQADYCLKLLNKMHFKSDEPSIGIDGGEESPIVFFDVEVFPNLFVICAKMIGHDNQIIKMINPSPDEVRQLFNYKLVGFNNRNYDNHIIYAAAMGYTNEALFKLSQRIIVDDDKTAKFGEAYNLSYTDIYDYSSEKKSLKKWEIDLGIHHQELGFPWDKPVDQSLWDKVADYCCDDVIATEATWYATQGDFVARCILAEISGLTPNDTTNQCSIKFIVGNDPNPQQQYVYTDLSTIFPGYVFNQYGFSDEEKKRLYKPDVKIVAGKSAYKGIDPGEGGRAIGYPGMYINVPVLDIESMHPHSAKRLNIFGDKYTKRFVEILEARLAIKHGDYDKARTMLDGVLNKFIDQIERGEITKKQLAYALKIVINSVYGLTSAKFDNKLRDPRNIDNIVAKYGALFMIVLEEEIERLGYKVVHVKTDSIKIENADDDIINFVIDFGKEYGFKFVKEHVYDKMCLLNDAVYVAHVCEEDGVELPPEKQYWTATGTQFQVPYVFKTLFSHEPIEFTDMCETKSVKTALYLDFDEQYELPFQEDGTETCNIPESERHNYVFVGRVGQFCPMLPGYGGGVLLRETDPKYWKEDGSGRFAAATGTKRPGKNAGVYRWMESEMVKKLGLEDKIDRSYYDYLVNEAVEAIAEHGDVEWFLSDRNAEFEKMDYSKGGSPDWMNIPEVDDDEIPFEAFMNEPE